MCVCSKYLDHKIFCSSRYTSFAFSTPFLAPWGSISYCSRPPLSTTTHSQPLPKRPGSIPKLWQLLLDDVEHRALRREPRCWTSLDVGKLDGLTASGLRRLPSSIPTTRIECLRLDEGRGSSFGAADWVAFLKQLECKDTLKRLNLATKKFGAGAKALKAVEPLVGGVEALRVVGIKNPQGVMAVSYTHLTLPTILLV